MLKEKTHKAYSGLANYCRTGKKEFTDNIGVRKDRIHHYRRLVFNITNGTLKQAYPITFKLFTKEQWNTIIDDFFVNHDAQEYRIWLMPKEFYYFAVENNYADKFNIPFLADLLLLEWIEIEVHTMEDEEQSSYVKEGDVWKDVLAINSEFRLVPLSYPVHIKATKLITASDKGNYFLFVYRSINNQSVQFMNISVLFAYIIEQIEENKSLDEILNKFCKLTSSQPTIVMKDEVKDFIQKLMNKNVVFGFKD